MADPQPIFAKGVESLLEAEGGITFAGYVASQEEALRSVADSNPDLILLDRDLPGLARIGLDRWIADRGGATPVVVLSAHDGGPDMVHALESGARGFVQKRSQPEVLLQAVRAALSGGIYLDPAVAGHLIAPHRGGPGHALYGSEAPRGLTDRERDVFRFIAFGFTNKEIAGKLGVTDKSVETYKARACEKLEIRSRAKIVQYALAQGWFDALKH